jgi:opacity protein-like surface antigen
MLRIFHLFIALTVLQTAVAQEKSKTEGKQSSVHLGLRAGFNGSVTTSGFGITSSYRDPSIKAGTFVGVFVSIPISSQFSFQPELSYSGEGSLQDIKISDASGNRYVLALTTQLQFLNLPLLIQYNKGHGFYAETGPQPGFLLKAQVTQEFPAPAQAPAKIQGTNNTTLSWLAGLGYNFRSGLGVGLRYSLGMTSYFDVPGITDQKVNTIQLGLQYRFKK